MFTNEKLNEIDDKYWYYLEFDVFTKEDIMSSLTREISTIMNNIDLDIANGIFFEEDGFIKYKHIGDGRAIIISIYEYRDIIKDKQIELNYRKLIPIPFKGVQYALGITI